MNNSAEKISNNIYPDDEIWKNVIGFEGLYEISNYGNIKSCRRYVNIKSGKRVVNEKLLSLAKDRDGYLMAILCQNGTKKTVKVHRLVANAFIDNVDGKPSVNHIDSNKSNNIVRNLEWVSNLENICHSKLKMKTTSKYIGVYFNKRDNVFRATATINRKNIFLGGFKNEQDAYNTRCKFLKENNIESKYL